MEYTVETSQGTVTVTTFLDGEYWSAVAGNEQVNGWFTEDRAVRAITLLIELKTEQSVE